MFKRRRLPSRDHPVSWKRNPFDRDLAAQQHYKLVEHRQNITKHGEDLAEIRDRRWSR
jgi:hypothetical protein